MGQVKRIKNWACCRCGNSINSGLFDTSCTEVNCQHRICAHCQIDPFGFASILSQENESTYQGRETWNHTWAEKHNSSPSQSPKSRDYSSNSNTPEPTISALGSQVLESLGEDNSIEENDAPCLPSSDESFDSSTIDLQVAHDLFDQDMTTVPFGHYPDVPSTSDQRSGVIGTRLDPKNHEEPGNFNSDDEGDFIGPSVLEILGSITRKEGLAATDPRSEIKSKLVQRLIIATKDAELAVSLDESGNYGKARKEYQRVCDNLESITAAADNYDILGDIREKIDREISISKSRIAKITLLMSELGEISEENAMTDAFAGLETEQTLSAPSIFSQSDAGSMNTTATVAPRILESIIDFISKDSETFQVCVVGLGGSSRTSFELRFRLVLKGFGLDLSKEAKTRDERGASRALRRNSQNIARSVCRATRESLTERKVQEDENIPVFDISTNLTHENLDESDGSDSDNGSIHDAPQIDDFLASSNAIHSYHREVRKLVQVEVIEEELAAEPEETETAPSLTNPLAGPLETQPEEIHSNNSSYRACSQQLTVAQELSLPLSLGIWIMTVIYVILALIGILFFVSAALRSPSHVEQRQLIRLLAYWMSPVPPGKTRVEITCSCGKRVVDDYTEIVPGGIERYRQKLEMLFRSSCPQNISSTSNASESTFNIQIAQKIWSTAKIWLLGTVSNLFRSITGSKNQVQQSTVELTEVVTHNTPGLSNLLFLLLCCPSQQKTPTLVQGEMHASNIQCDKSFYQFLRSSFQKATRNRSKIQQILSFKKLQSIRFVKFGLYQREIVEVIRMDDLPPKTNPDYIYSWPEDVMPPVGPNLMMCLFNDPSHACEVPFLLERVPKKVREKLTFSPTKGFQPSWGLHFVMGWNFKLLWILAFILIGMGSLIFGVLWSVYRKSIQDAFAVSAYMVAMVGVFIGFAHAIVEL